MPQTVGLKQLAEDVGMSISTVSRALSGSDLVRADTRRRILAAANARRMEGSAVRGRTPKTAGNMVMLLQPAAMQQANGDTEVSIHVLETLQDVAEESGCGILAGRFRTAKEQEAGLDLNENVVGVVGFRLLDSHMAPFLARVRNANVPFVVLNREDDDPTVPTCTTDHTLAGRMAIDHLVKLGHERIGLLFNSMENQSNRLRIDGIEASLRAHRLGIPPEQRVTGHEDLNGAAKVAQQLIQQEKVTALVVAPERMAANLLYQLSAAGIRVPDDVSIISFDGTALTRQQQPQLTALHTPWQQMAKAATRLLFWLRDDPMLDQVKLNWKPNLLPGETCQPPSAE